jgi:hypothetical protein
MIVTRLLPPEEWYRLETTDLAPVWRQLYAKRDHVDILVAEDAEGEILGHVAFPRFIHCEGFGIVEPERRNGRVMRALLDGMRDYCAARHVEGVWASSITPVMDDLLARRGADPLPGSHYLWHPNGKPSTLAED